MQTSQIINGGAWLKLEAQQHVTMLFYNHVHIDIIRKTFYLVVLYFQLAINVQTNYTWINDRYIVNGSNIK